MNLRQTLNLDLRSLTGYLIRKSRWFIASVFIGCILGALIAVADSYQHSTYNADKELLALQGVLTEGEITEVQRVFNQYKLLLEQQSNLRDYQENSILMTLNSNAAPNLKHQYLIQTSKMSIKDTFTSALLDQDVYDEIAKVYGPDIPSRSIADLFGISALSDYEEFEVNADTIMIRDNQSSIVNDYNLVLEIEIWGTDKEHCNDTLSIIQHAIQNKIRELTSIDSQLSIVDLGGSYSEIDSPELRNKQQDFLTTVSQISKSINTFGSDSNSNQGNQLAGLTEEQKTYFDLLKKTVSSEGVFNPHYVRRVTLGAVIGLIISVFCIILAYINNDSIKSVYEINQIIPVICYCVFFDDSKKKNHMFRLISSIIEEAKKRALLHNKALVTAEEVLAIMNNNNINKVFISLHSKDTEAQSANESLFNTILRRLNEKGEIEVLTGNPMEDPNAMRFMSSSDAVIWMNELWSTKAEDIISEKYICEKLGIHELGAVVLNII